MQRALLEELGGVILRGKFTKPLMARGLTAGELLNGYAALCRIVHPVEIQRTSIGPDDDAVLATALAAPADLIVSGDAHLLNLKAFHRIPIITAAEAVNRIAQSSRS
ncbi:MAG TPA: putative toxin-antitoxin system toxin component, PIN family [Burkholderiales bacterium]|nr:putative toxin-antitoxin system toxin component, PIN family [Burkholderiales bacterium]